MEMPNIRGVGVGKKGVLSWETFVIAKAVADT